MKTRIPFSSRRLGAERSWDASALIEVSDQSATRCVLTAHPDKRLDPIAP